MSENPTVTFIPEPNSPDISTIDPALLGIDPTITTETIRSQSAPFSFSSTSGELTINGNAILGYPELFTQLPNPNLNNQLVLPQLQVGGTIMSNDIILGSDGITNLISDNTGTYIWNDLSVSGVINNSDLQSKLSNKSNKITLSAPSITPEQQMPDLTYVVDDSSNSYPLESSDDIIISKSNNTIKMNISEAFENNISLSQNTALGLKANSSDVYTKTEIDTSLSSKANSSDVYTKTQVDTSLGLKANLDNPSFTGLLTAVNINATNGIQVNGQFLSSTYQAKNPVQGLILVSGTTPSISSTSGTSTITGVTRTGVGVYTITWSPTINTSTYGVIGILRNTAGYMSYNSTLGTQMNILTFNTSGQAVDSSFSFYIFK